MRNLVKEGFRTKLASLTRLYRDVGQQNLKFEIEMLSTLFDLRNGKEGGGNDVLMR